MNEREDKIRFKIIIGIMLILFIISIIISYFTNLKIEAVKQSIDDSVATSLLGEAVVTLVFTFFSSIVFLVVTWFFPKHNLYQELCKLESEKLKSIALIIFIAFSVFLIWGDISCLVRYNSLGSEAIPHIFNLSF